MMDLANWVETLRTAFAAVLISAYAYLPRLVGATTVLLLGWGLAKLLRLVVGRLLRRAQSLIPARILGAENQESVGFVMRVVGGLSYWLVWLLAAAAAAEVLGLSALTGGLAGFASYVPRLISAVLVLLGGVVCGTIAASWMRSFARVERIAYGDSAARAARTTIIMFASVVALAQVGIDSTLLVVGVGTVLGAFLGAVALAFGLGARATVANIIGAHYVQRSYKVNQRIRIGENEGQILEIRPTGVLLDTRDGVVHIPASTFTERVSTALGEDTL